MFILISVVICVIVVVSGTPATPDIEEFIEKLLIADRFDVLVEKVAERAVEKLKSMKKDGGSLTGDKWPKGHPRDKPDRPNVLRNVEANEKLEFKQKPPTHRGMPGKIDIQAVKEKFGTVDSEKLSLNYKRFTSGKHFHENFKMPERSVPPSLPTSPSSHVEIFELLNLRQDKHKYKEHSKDMDFTFNKREEPKKQEAEFSIENYNKKNDKRIPNKITDEILELNNDSPKHIFNLETYLSHDDENKYSNSSLPFISQKKSRAQDSAKSTVKHKIMPESLNKNNFRTKTQDTEFNELTEEESPADNKQTVIEIIDQNNSVQDRQSVVVRRENGKLYTFQKSPDYEEYHDALERKKNYNSIELSLDGNRITIHS